MAFGGITGKATTNWTNDEILSTATAQSLGLSAGATPDEAFTLISENINRIVIKKGQYSLPLYGDNTLSINVGFRPKFVIWFSTANDSPFISSPRPTGVSSDNRGTPRIIIDGLNNSSITSNGFSIEINYEGSSTSSATFYYIAVG